MAMGFVINLRDTAKVDSCWRFLFNLNLDNFREMFTFLASSPPLTQRLGAVLAIYSDQDLISAFVSVMI